MSRGRRVRRTIPTITPIPGRSPALIKSFIFKQSVEYSYSAPQIAAGSNPKAVTFNVGKSQFLPLGDDVSDSLVRIFDSYSSKRLKSIRYTFKNFRLHVIKQYTPPDTITGPGTAVPQYETSMPRKFNILHYHARNLLVLDTDVVQNSIYKHTTISGPKSGWTTKQIFRTSTPTEHSFSNLRADTDTEEKYLEYINFIERNNGSITTAAAGTQGILVLATNGSTQYKTRPSQYPIFQIACESQWPGQLIDQTTDFDANPNIKIRYHMLFDIESETEFSLWGRRENS